MQHLQAAEEWVVRDVFQGTAEKTLPLTYVLTACAAGFPSPAEEWLTERKLDLNDALILNEPSTYFMRATGESMVDRNIVNESILVVDASLKRDLYDGCVVVASINNALTVKEIKQENERLFLVSANANGKFPPLEITAHTEFAVWGVITAAIHIQHPHLARRLGRL